ncbi:MAG: hypothetical protein QOG39_408 [Acidimicrobiaceae bacterium]
MQTRRTCPPTALLLAVLVTIAQLSGCSDAKRPQSASASSPAGGSSAAGATTIVGPPVLPLTGLPVGDAPLGRPALSVKIDNVVGALPQSGLNNADIVYEELVEGGQTRLFATFHSQDAGLVGPIRSARPVDADLLNQLGGGIFAYSGAADAEIAPVEEHSGATLLSYDAGVSAFRRDSRLHTAPHNVYSSTPELYEAGAAAGDRSATPPQQFQYGADVGNGRPVQDVSMTMGLRSANAWHWNAASAQYERAQNGEADVLDDGAPISATNVVIMSVQIQGTGIFDTIGEEDPLVVVIGEGPCWLLRDGQLVEGRWSRPATTSPTTFHDAQGHDLLLHPGRTWVELLPAPEQPTFG